jgi:hypothetical protein
MKTFYVVKSTAVFYSALIQAETKEEAEQLFLDVDLDDCCSEETSATLCDYDTEEVNAKDFDLGITVKTKDDYEVVKQ